MSYQSVIVVATLGIMAQTVLVLHVQQVSTKVGRVYESTLIWIATVPTVVPVVEMASTVVSLQVPPAQIVLDLAPHLTNPQALQAGPLSLQCPHQESLLGLAQSVMLMVIPTLALGVKHALQYDVSCHSHFGMVA
jgi:hypothetical protein